MSKTIKTSIISALILLSLVLLIFCPISTMRVELNDGITKGICNVSIFTALTYSTIFADNFTFTLQTTEWAIVLIIILQIIGLVLTTTPKTYIVGVMSAVLSWILLLSLSLIVVKVQSDLFNLNGAVQQQSISVFVIFIMLPELALIIFNSFNHFRPIKVNK